MFNSRPSVEQNNPKHLPFIKRLLAHGLVETLVPWLGCVYPPVTVSISIYVQCVIFKWSGLTHPTVSDYPFFLIRSGSFQTGICSARTTAHTGVKPIYTTASVDPVPLSRVHLRTHSLYYSIVWDCRALRGSGLFGRRLIWFLPPVCIYRLVYNIYNGKSQSATTFDHPGVVETVLLNLVISTDWAAPLWHRQLFQLQERDALPSY